MGIYDDIADILGLDSESEDADSVEQKLMDKLQDLNKRRRMIDNQIDELNNRIDELQDEVAHHNKLAMQEMRSDREDRARKELRQKQQKIKDVQKKQRQVSELRKSLDKLSDKREEIEDALERIRNIKVS